MNLKDFMSVEFTRDDEKGHALYERHGDKAVTRKFDGHDHVFPHTNYRNVSFWVALEDGSVVGLNEHPTWGYKYVRAGKRAVNTYYEKTGVKRPAFETLDEPTEVEETDTATNPVATPVPTPELPTRYREEGVERTKLTRKRWTSLDSLRRYIIANATKGEEIVYFDGLSLLTNAASYYLGPEGVLRVEEL